MNGIGAIRSCIEKPLRPPQIQDASLQTKALRAAFLKNKIWPKEHVLKVQFIETPKGALAWTPLAKLKSIRSDGKINNPDPIEGRIRELNSPQEAVKTVVMERIQPIIGMQIEFISDNNSRGDIRIGFNPDEGSYSLVGVDAIKQDAPKKTMNFGWLDAGTIIHEFGHALGMIHEHQNPRGKPIPWNLNKLYEWAKKTQGWDKKTTDTNIVNRYDINQINGSDFDPLSVMLYFFSKELTMDDKGTDMNNRLSRTDVLWINNMYPNSRVTPDYFYRNVYGENITGGWSISVIFKSLFVIDRTRIVRTIVSGLLIISILVLIFMGTMRWWKMRLPSFKKSRGKKVTIAKSSRYGRNF